MSRIQFPTCSKGEPNSKNSFTSLISTNAEEPFLLLAMREILSYEAARIEKRMLDLIERDPVLPLAAYLVVCQFNVLLYRFKFFRCRYRKFNIASSIMSDVADISETIWWI